MPTTKIINSDGSGDYTTLQAWANWAATQASADQWALVRGDGDVGSVVLSGWTATPTSSLYPRIYTDNQHSGDLTGSRCGKIENHLNFLRIEYLRIHYSTNAIENYGSTVRFNGNLLYGETGSGSPIILLGSGSVRITNNFIINIEESSVTYVLDITNQSLIFYNNTTDGYFTDLLIARTGSSITLDIANNIFGFDSYINGFINDSGSVISSNQISANIFKGTDPYSDPNSLQDSLLEDYFRDKNSDWKNFGDAPWVDVGTSSTYDITQPNDAFGTSRSSSDFDWGAYEWIEGDYGGHGLNAYYYTYDGSWRNDNLTWDNDIRTFPKRSPDAIAIETNFYRNSLSGNFVIPPNIPSYEYLFIKFVGWIKPRYTESYTFSFSPWDDYGKLYIDGNLVIDYQGGGVGNTGNISLTANKLYPIEILWFNHITDAQFKVNWSSSSQTSEVIPPIRLFSDPGVSNFFLF